MLYLIQAKAKALTMANQSINQGLHHVSPSFSDLHSYGSSLHSLYSHPLLFFRNHALCYSDLGSLYLLFTYSTLLSLSTPHLLHVFTQMSPSQRSLLWLIHLKPKTSHTVQPLSSLILPHSISPLNIFLHKIFIFFFLLYLLLSYLLCLPCPPTTTQLE